MSLHDEQLEEVKNIFKNSFPDFTPQWGNPADEWRTMLILFLDAYEISIGTSSPYTVASGQRWNNEIYGKFASEVQAYEYALKELIARLGE